MIKQIRILRCPDPLRWYASHIGEIFPFLGDTGWEYRSQEPDGYINFIQYADAEIIENEYTTSEKHN